MKKIKFLIILVSIIILIISLLLLILNTKKELSIEPNGVKNNVITSNSNNNEQNNNSTNIITEEFINTMEKEEQKLKEYSKVNSTETYYTIESLINTYINSIFNKDYNSLYNITSQEYIKSNNVNVNNIKDYNRAIKEEENFIAKDMYWIEGKNIQTYSVYGEVWNEHNTKILQEEYYIVELDMGNETFAITPCINKKYNNIKDVKIFRSEGTIEKNNYNTFVYSDITEEKLAKKYFSYINNCMLYYPNKIYNILDKEYRDKRFINEDNFNEYVKEKKFYIYRSILNKYKKIKTEDKVVFSLIDNYNNHYILNQTNPMEFTLLLDDYTIKVENFTQKYQELDESQKYAYHLDLFKKMINSRDYNGIYNTLDNAFKSNNFSNVSELKKYIKNNFYNYNIIEAENVEKKDKYKIFDCVIQNQENKLETKKIKIIIKLENETDGKISFIVN